MGTVGEASPVVASLQAELDRLFGKKRVVVTAPGRLKTRLNWIRISAKVHGDAEVVSTYSKLRDYLFRVYDSPSFVATLLPQGELLLWAAIPNVEVVVPAFGSAPSG